MIMSENNNQAIATLAAAIVIARGAKSVSDIQEAWTDARWTIIPVRENTDYKDWQQKHGLVPAPPTAPRPLAPVPVVPPPAPKGHPQSWMR